jgi:hypothetical protein
MITNACFCTLQEVRNAAAIIEISVTLNFFITETLLGTHAQQHVPPHRRE